MIATPTARQPRSPHPDPVFHVGQHPGVDLYGSSLQNQERRRQQRRIGAAIRRLRKAAKLTQIELAERAGLEASSVVRHERGIAAMSLASAISYANALGTTLDALAGRATDGLTRLVRTEAVHVVDLEAVAALTKARQLSQVRKWRFDGYWWGCVVEPENQVVTREQYAGTVTFWLSPEEPCTVVACPPSAQGGTLVDETGDSEDHAITVNPI